MSPLRTLTNCASSSIFALRKKWPQRVMRGSCWRVTCVFISGTSRMVRILTIENNLPFRPTLSCKKKPLFFVSKWAMRAASPIIQPNNNNPTSEPATSIKRLIRFWIFGFVIVCSKSSSKGAKWYTVDIIFCHSFFPRVAKFIH